MENNEHEWAKDCTGLHEVTKLPGVANVSFTNIVSFEFNETASAQDFIVFITEILKKSKK